MSFEIGDNIIRVYQDGIDAIINQLGKAVLIIKNPTETVCPNCHWDSNKQRSSGRYKTDNPNTLNGPLNKPFVNGQVCPVCRGYGKLVSERNNLQIKATTIWNPQEEIMDDNGTKIALPNGVCKLKTFSSYYDDVVGAKEFQVAFDEKTEGSPKFANCEMFKKPTPRGLKYNRYMVFYLRLKQN